MRYGKSPSEVGTAPIGAAVAVKVKVRRIRARRPRIVVMFANNHGSRRRAHRANGLRRRRLHRLDDLGRDILLVEIDHIGRGKRNGHARIPHIRRDELWIDPCPVHRDDFVVPGQPGKPVIRRNPRKPGPQRPVERLAPVHRDICAVRRHRSADGEALAASGPRTARNGSSFRERD